VLAQLRRILDLVDRGVQARLGIFIAVSAVATLLDSASLALIFVLFRALVQPEALAQLDTVAQIRGSLGLAEDRVFLALLTLSLFLALFTKILLQLVAARLRLRIEWKIRNQLSQRLFAAYLNGPYAILSRRNTGEIVNTIWTGVGQIGMGAVGLADLLGDTLLVLAINATLFYLQPWLTLAAIIVLALASVAYFLLLRPKIAGWGRRSKTASERMFSAVTEPLAGIKQIKTLGVERFFAERFRAEVLALGRPTRHNAFAGQALKPLLELVVVAGLLLPIAFLLLRGVAVVEIVPILALFGTAAYRLLPSFARMSTLLQALNFARPVIDLVATDLARFEHPGAFVRVAATPPVAFRHELRLDHVGFTFEDASEPALHNVSLTIRRGQSVALVGPSGAGKTTLADVILGLLSPTSGSILVDGRPAPGGCRPNLFGYVPQDSFLLNDTIRCNIALGADRVDESRVLDAVEAASLGAFIATLPDGLDTVVGERGVRLSGGQRQRLAIARALYNKTDVLILDESTSALDATTEAMVAEAINRLKGSQTLIIIAHRLSTVRNCDRLFFLLAGRIVDEGSFAELVVRNATFRAMVQEMELAHPGEAMVETAIRAAR
jgi:ABC-type multidrug transport system fused ATPase/permease subunit